MARVLHNFVSTIEGGARRGGPRRIRVGAMMLACAGLPVFAGCVASASSAKAPNTRVSAPGDETEALPPAEAEAASVRPIGGAHVPGSSGQNPVVLRRLPVLASSKAGADGASVVVGHPPGWIPLHTDRAQGALTLHQPESGAELWVVAVSHPDALGPWLSRFRRRFHDVVPGVPESASLPGLRPEWGERATRFGLGGRLKGEMFLVEKGRVHVLYLTVAAPDAWPQVARTLPAAYANVSLP